MRPQSITKMAHRLQELEKENAKLKQELAEIRDELFPSGQVNNRSIYWLFDFLEGYENISHITDADYNAMTNALNDAYMEQVDEDAIREAVASQFTHLFPNNESPWLTIPYEEWVETYQPVNLDNPIFDMSMKDAQKIADEGRLWCRNNAWIVFGHVDDELQWYYITEKPYTGHLNARVQLED